MHEHMKLGKLAPRHDDRTLMLASYLTPHLPTPPPTITWSTKVPTWPMYANDALGDCTAAAAGHMVQCWSANATTEQTVTDGDVIRFYSGSTGYNPSDPSSDRGGIELDVLKFWKKDGIGNHKIGAFVAVSPASKTLTRDAIYLFGGAYIGIALPISAQKQRVWDVPTSGLRGKGAPGSWGGHAVPIVDCDARGLTVVTWGALKRMTWAFYQAYCDEAYAVLSSDFLNGTKAPNGFDLTALQEDLAALLPDRHPRIASEESAFSGAGRRRPRVLHGRRAHRGARRRGWVRARRLPDHHPGLRGHRGLRPVERMAHGERIRHRRLGCRWSGQRRRHVGRGLAVRASRRGRRQRLGLCRNVAPRFAKPAQDAIDHRQSTAHVNDRHRDQPICLHRR